MQITTPAGATEDRREEGRRDHGRHGEAKHCKAGRGDIVLVTLARRDVRDVHVVDDILPAPKAAERAR